MTYSARKRKKNPNVRFPMQFSSLQKVVWRVSRRKISALASVKEDDEKKSSIEQATSEYQERRKVRDQEEGGKPIDTSCPYPIPGIVLFYIRKPRN